LTTSGCPRGLALAREPGWLLVWDEHSWLYLLNRTGQRQGQTRARGTLAAVCGADDGSAYAAVGSTGEVWWLAPDLMPRWERTLPHRAVAAALDSFGQYLAVADANGQLHLFSRAGRPVCQVQALRPLVHLAFVTEAPLLVGSADFGLVACFDLTGRCVWRDGLVANIGALTVSGDGARIMLACFSEGLLCYSLAGRRQDRLPLSEPCGLAALSYDGRFTLAGTLDSRLLLLDREGQNLTSYPLDHPAAALALAPLADSAFAALPDGHVVALDLRDVLRR
jgi:hypothetical protein